MNEIIFLVEEAAEGGLVARALGEAIFTEADDLPSLESNIRVAVRCHFDEANMPRVIRLHSRASRSSPFETSARRFARLFS
ncbi:MAG: 2-oxoisovalerate dehydrogenase [Acidobacteriota bacterium]